MLVSSSLAPPTGARDVVVLLRGWSGDMKDTASPWRSCKHYYTDNNICYCALLVIVYFSLFPGNTI